MTRLGMTLLCALQVAATSALADNLIEPGQWKVTATTVMNGAATPPQAKARCLTPEQTGDVAKTFGPVSGTVNSTCEMVEHELTPQRLKWHLQCTGQLDMDLEGEFLFDAPEHYSATVTTASSMLGRQLQAGRMTIEGQRVGECQ